MLSFEFESAPVAGMLYFLHVTMPPKTYLLDSVVDSGYLTNAPTVLSNTSTPRIDDYVGVGYQGKNGGAFAAGIGLGDLLDLSNCLTSVAQLSSSSLGRPLTRVVWQRTGYLSVGA
jgi:hypothetical protein